MKSMKIQFVILLLLVGLLSACAAPATEAPASPATEEAAPATEAPTSAPAATDTSAPATAAESSPTSAPAVSGPTTVSFANDVLPILNSRCANCHGGSRTEEGLSVKSHADVMKGSEGGPVIVPGDAANSLLAQLVESQDMPKRGPKLTPDQVQIIVTWINEGAQDN